MVVNASTPMTIPEMVRKLRSLWRAMLRMISIGLMSIRALHGQQPSPQCGATTTANVAWIESSGPPEGLYTIAPP